MGVENEIGLQAKTDREAFATIYDTYFDAFYDYCWVVSGSVEAAEHMVGHFFSELVTDLERGKYKGKIPFDLWILRRLVREKVPDIEPEERWKYGEFALQRRKVGWLQTRYECDEDTINRVFGLKHRVVDLIRDIV